MEIQTPKSGLCNIRQIFKFFYTFISCSSNLQVFSSYQRFSFQRKLMKFFDLFPLPTNTTNGIITFDCYHLEADKQLNI